MAILGGITQKGTLLQNRLTDFVNSRNTRNFRKQPLQFRKGMSRKIIRNSPLNRMKRNLIHISRSKTNIIRAEARMRQSIRSIQTHRVGRAFQNIG